MSFGIDPVRQAAKGLDAGLPPSYRGRRGYSRLLLDIPIRVSISGTRGKSSLTEACEREFRERGYQTYAKSTGTDPVSIRQGVSHPIARPQRPAALFDENIREIKRWWGGGLDVLVLENQAISPYTMRVFNHRFCRPHYLLVLNVRADHMAEMGENLLMHAQAFGRSAPPGSTLISGESDPERAYQLRRAAEGVDVRFVDASPRGIHPPGYESLTVLDALLRAALGDGLSVPYVDRERQRLEDHFRWRRSALPGIDWFHGAEINDIDSTRVILRYLQRGNPRRVSFIGYFRADRRDRTRDYVDFLGEALAAGECERVYVAGGGATAVRRRLRAWKDRIRVYYDDPEGASLLVDTVAVECRDEAVMTIVNAVPPFPRAVASALARRGPDGAVDTEGGGGSDLSEQSDGSPASESAALSDDAIEPRVAQ